MNKKLYLPKTHIRIKDQAQPNNQLKLKSLKN